MTSITGASPHAAQLGTLQKTPDGPGPVLAPDIKKLLGDLQTHQGKLDGVHKLRGELAQLREHLQKDVQLLREHGHKMPPHERKAIMERVDRGMAHARELENRIVAHDPKAQQALGQLRHERAEVQKHIQGTVQELSRLHADPIGNRVAIDKQMQLLNHLMARQQDIGVRTDAVLGLRGASDAARSELMAVRKEMRTVAQQLAQPKLPPDLRQKLEARLEQLGRKHADLEQQIVANNPRAQQELKAARENMRSLGEQAAKVHMALHKLEQTGGSKAEAMQLKETLRGLEDKMRATSAHIDRVLGLRTEPHPIKR